MYKKKLSFVVLLLSLIVCSKSFVFAQDASDWYYDKPIKAVLFEGLNTIKASEMEGITSSFIGRKFTDDSFADLINRVYALDCFEDITPQAVPGDADKSSVTILFIVVEYPVISKISFSGNKQVRNGELKEAISIKEKDVFNEGKILLDERAVRNSYLEKGFTNATVSSSYEKKEDGIHVVFKIDEGKPTVISKIKFQGNVVVAEKTLKKKLSLKEVGLIQKGAFQESMLEADKQAVLTYYKDRGYVDANVIDVLKDTVFNEDKKRDEITLTFVIQEGSQYNFGGVTFTGNRIFTTEQLMDLVKLKPGAVFNSTKFQESMTAVTDLYYENGYTANNFIPSVDKDTNTKTVSYKIDIIENPRSHIESIVIRGNAITKDYVIRREISFQEGDIFSKAKLITSVRNLYNTQYFSNIIPDFLPGSEDNLIDLVFNVEEQNTRTLEFGFQFNGVTTPDQFPISLNLKIQNSNLFGEGKTIGAATNLSADEQSLELNYGQNWLFGLPIMSSINASYSHTNNYAARSVIMPNGKLNTDDFYLNYESHEISLGFSLGRRWTPDFAILTLTGGISGSLINNIYPSDLWVPTDSTIADYKDNLAPQNSFFSQFSMDARDVNYDPSTGWFLSQRLTWFGLLPGVEKEFYLRSDTKAEVYFKLIDKPIKENWGIKVVFMAYSGFTFQCTPNDVYAPGPTNRLYIDGLFNGRGWNIYNLKRGMAMWNNTMELRMPVVPGIIALDMFLDISTIKTDMSAFVNDFSNKDDWYFSWGPAIRFLIPQFPLKFVVVNTFKINENGLQGRNRYDKIDTAFWDSWRFTLSLNVVNK